MKMPDEDIVVGGLFIQRDEILPLEEYLAMESENRPRRVIISALHLILTVSAFLFCWFKFNDWLYAILAYLGGYFVIHLIIKEIPYIGYYKPGYQEIWNNGECIKIADKNHVEYYGFASIGAHVFVEFIAYIIIGSLTLVIFPDLIAALTILGAFFFIVFRYILIPLINDIVNIVSPTSKHIQLKKFKEYSTNVGSALMVLIIIGGSIIFPIIGPKSFIAENVIEEYYDKHTDLRNPFYGVDLDNASLDFKSLGTKCVLTTTEDLVYESGLVKSGKSYAYFSYWLTHWELDRTQLMVESISVKSPVTFEGSKTFGESNPHYLNYNFAMTLNEFNGEEGTGTFTITHKETNEVIYSSPLRIANEYYDKYRVYLDKELPKEYGAKSGIHCEYITDNDAFYVSDFGIRLNMKNK